MKRGFFFLLALLCLVSLLPFAAAPVAEAKTGSDALTLADLDGLDKNSTFTMEQLRSLLQEAYDLGYQAGLHDAGVPASPAPGVDYVLNTNSHKFHYPDCKSVADISPKNRQDFIGSRDEVLTMGYIPCKRCNP